MNRKINRLLEGIRRELGEHGFGASSPPPIPKGTRTAKMWSQVGNAPETVVDAIHDWMQQINVGRHPFIGNPQSVPSSAEMKQLPGDKGKLTITFNQWKDYQGILRGVSKEARKRVGRLGQIDRVTYQDDITQGEPLVIAVTFKP